ncbi:baseplate J/gp47 family protein [Gluconobacter albidus]|uniref:baseplate J/gp47 family protein n=1 Tax=Gluconobacter albidus TaxID=318683 RepID=UPI00078665E2|nr:baseplate J/gp47 family protein [Gluconobacter albidus]
MAYAYPTFETIRKRMEQDIVNSTGVNLPDQSVLRTIARSDAKEVYYMWAFLQYLILQSSPATATDVYLEEWASLKGITRKSASLATGSVSFSGTSNTSIPAGTVLQRSDGFIYTTNVLSNVGNSVPITATVSGTSGNASAGSMLSLISPIAGVDASVTLTNSIENGTPLETDDQLRVRVIDAFKVRSVGGSSQDHVDWALAVPGVTAAWVNPVPVMPGQVTLYVMMDRTNQYQGFPQGSDGSSTLDTRWQTATGDQLSVANALQSQKPVSELLLVCSPIKVSTDITLTGLKSASASMQSAIKTSLTTLFENQGSPLGSVISQASIIAAISSVTGSTDFTLTAPSGNVTTTLGQLPVIGNITYS